VGDSQSSGHLSEKLNHTSNWSRDEKETDARVPSDRDHRGHSRDQNDCKSPPQDPDHATPESHALLRCNVEIRFAVQEQPTHTQPNNLIMV